MIRTLLFDAYGTLIEVEKGASAREILGYMRERGSAPEEAEFLSYWKAFYKRETASGMPFRAEQEIFTDRIRQAYARYGTSRDAAADAAAQLAAAQLRPLFPEVKAALAALRERYRVCIASNTDTDALNGVLTRTGLAVDAVYTSEALRCYKPDPAFYRAVLGLEGADSAEILFIGDSPAEDILGPGAAGMSTALIDRAGRGGDHGQTLTCRDLTELADILLNRSRG